MFAYIIVLMPSRAFIVFNGQPARYTDDAEFMS